MKPKIISFKKFIERIIHNIIEYELPYGSTYKLLSNKKDMKVQEEMIAQENLSDDKKLFNVFRIEERKERLDSKKKTAYHLELWIRFINPRFKCRRFIYPGDYIARLEFNTFSGWGLHFFQDAINEYGDHEFSSAEHPHIQRGNGCFGGHKTAIDNALWSGNFFAAIKLMRKYLEEYNGRDTYIKGKYFDKQEGFLNVTPLSTSTWQRDTLTTEEREELKELKPIHFKTYRVKRDFQMIMQKSYQGECWQTGYDILNTYKFFNKVGRFEFPETEKDGLPIEQTLKLIRKFKRFNPSFVNDKNNSEVRNPIWLNFNQSDTARINLSKEIPDYNDVYMNATRILTGNGGYYFQMQFKFSLEELKKIKNSISWWKNQMESTSSRGLDMQCAKWITQNPEAFLGKVEQIINTGLSEEMDGYDMHKLYNLKEEVKETLPEAGILLEEATACIEDMRELTIGLQHIVNQKKLTYLERERRKVLNEINNHKPKQETYQLSLDSL